MIFWVTSMLVADDGEGVGDKIKMLVADLIHRKNHQHNEKSHQHNDSVTNILNRSPS